ncbi:hypothetical protein PIB30_016999 [Stylosanthes scabra]|uniref:Wall-associated receptor kinase galacturonan-binding domain-containing protein n=1 Tax=Stylosanthes scabra TaxID=79078 RepID=A0ABU6Z472_9FABA|nr:hypothetical protein [Stylosanthes scabra]
MKPLLLHHTCSISMFILALIVMATNNVTTSLGAETNSDYLACKNTLSCGDITGLTYPFWGVLVGNNNNRPKNCGVPNLEITCQEDNNNNGIPKFTVDSVTYRILHWDLNKKNLTVARDDYFEGGFDLCSGAHSNNTLDQTILQYDDNNPLLYYAGRTFSFTLQLLHVWTSGSLH